MKVRHLHYFVKIVEAGSISGAAATIHIAQPALSQQITQLEEDLGVRLLERSARGVRPTAAGEVLYREASSILRQIEQLRDVVRSAGGEPEGTLSVGMSSTLASFLAGPFMEASKQALRKLTLRLVTDHSMQLKSQINAHTLDLALLFEDEPTPGFVRKPLFRQRFYLIRSGPPPGDAASITLEHVARLPLILPGEPNLARVVLDRAFAAAGVVPNVVAETNMLSGLLSAMHSGIGGTILPKGDFSDVPGYGAVSAVPIDPPICVTATILASSAIPLTRAGEAVRDLLGEFVQRRIRDAPPLGAEWIGS